jgi:class III poly(R)-hydroxyalkanoic acid synthase PhaE subunit
VAQAQNHHNWIDAWLETQQGWLGRWQSIAVEQRVDGMRVAMETLRKYLNPAEVSPEALNVVQGFQTLLQSCMANAGELSGIMGAGSDAAQNPLRQMFDAFPVGPAREQQVAWQTYLKAHADYQLQLTALLQAYGQVVAISLQLVPEQVAALAAQGKPITRMRELYELWIECGERAFAIQARDPAFTAAQAACANALSRLKLAQQTLMEGWLKAHDLPTRSELNSVHLRLRTMTARIAELEQQLASCAATDAAAIKPVRTARKPGKS